MSVALASLVVASCSLLDVSPRGQNESKEFLKTETGYKYAITGVYQSMAAAELYGRDMSFELPEWLVRNFVFFDIQPDDDEFVFSTYTFEDQRGDSRLSITWRQFYHAISQVNDMITALEENNVDFSSPMMAGVVEGELYALRAYLHLEVLRFWGPVPNATATEGVITVPYMTEATLDGALLTSDTWKTVVDGIESDLSRAEAVLRTSDPIIAANIVNKYGEPTTMDALDGWFQYRQNRMNFFAVLGTKARFYSWLENAAYKPTDAGTQSADARANVVHYAWMVYNGTPEYQDAESATKLFELMTSADLSNSGFTLYGESLMALDVPDLQDNQKSFNTTGTAGDGYPLVFQVGTVTDGVYELANYGMNDFRYTSQNLWEQRTFETTPISIFRKYKDFLNPAQDAAKVANANQVPLLRLSEIYLLLMEYHPDFATAQKLFHEWTLAKGMDSSVEATFTDDGGRQARIGREYQKEFYGEGQFFFYCKRKALPNIPVDGYPLPGGVASYVIPKPTSQTNFE